MIYAYFNDRPLFGQRTGVGHYLERMLAHWPADSGLRPRGFGEVLGRSAKVGGPGGLVYPSIDALPACPLVPLSSLRRPGGSGGADLRMRAARRGFEFGTRRLASLLARRKDFGLLFEPNHLPAARVGPCVATIHDLSVLELPQFHPAHRVDWWARSMQRAMAGVDRFICVSGATRDAMVRALGCPAERLCVVPLASRWGPAPSSWSAPGVRMRLGMPERYVLHVGTIEPRKNIGRLLDAYGSWSAEERQRTKLVLCGRGGWGDASFWASIVEHPAAGEVLWSGYADDAQVAAMMRGAAGVLCPSHYEGFGLPTIEAMTIGAPCAISGAPSLVEVAGGTATIVDAEDTEGWASVMRALGETPVERVEAARKRAAGFSWEATSRGHLAAFESVITA